MPLSATVLDILRGFVLLALMAGFLGIWIWAWKRERKSGFRDASLMPLEDDETAPSVSHEMKSTVTHGMKEIARE
jgi:cbb3-type cytochrome oxidase subunit 3